MGGFGATLAHGLLGGLEGYGKYLTQEGATRAKEAEDDRASQRDRALLDYRASLANDAATRDHADKIDEIRVSGGINRANNVAEIGARATADQANDERTAARDTANRMLDFRHQLALEGVKLTADKERILYTQQQQAAYSADRRGMQAAGNDVDNDTGTRLLYFRDGQGGMHTYDTGVVVQAKSTVDPITGAVVRNTAPPTRRASAGWRGDPPAAGGGAPAMGTGQAGDAGPPAAGAAPSGARRDTPGGKVYTEADLQETMRSNRMTRTQVMTLLEQRGYRMAL